MRTSRMSPTRRPSHRSGPSSCCLASRADTSTAYGWEPQRPHPSGRSYVLTSNPSLGNIGGPRYRSQTIFTLEANGADCGAATLVGYGEGDCEADLPDYTYRRARDSTAHVPCVG